MTIRTKDELRAIFVTGHVVTEQNLRDLIDTLISQVNDKLPDENGEVTTDFRIIPSLPPDAPPSEYPEGTSEFVIAYNKDDYTSYIQDNPSLGQLVNGSIAVRTFKLNNMEFQTVNNINQQSLVSNVFYRIGMDSGNSWGELTIGTETAAILAQVPDFSGSPLFEISESRELTINTQMLGNQLADGDTLTVNNDGKLVASGIGEKGDVGPQGPPGPEGMEGPPGPQGPKGEDGINGLNGMNGERGSIGPAGPQGIQGIAGPKGDQGNQGPQGIQGIAGPQGLIGPVGIQGPEGPEGPRGLQGEGFQVTSSYPTLSALEADIDNLEAMKFYSVAGTDSDNGNVYFYSGTNLVFQFQASGVQGPEGERGPRGYSGNIRIVSTITGTSENDVESKIPDYQVAGYIEGDALWIVYPNYSGLWVFTEDPRMVVGSGFVKGPNLRGPQGEQGVNGLQGAQGERGADIRVVGTVASESGLPSTAQQGDAYWIGSRLYIWNQFRSPSPGFVMGQNLRGPEGVAGPTGPQGPQGIPGQTPEGIGTAELLTNEKTIREAINEVFTSGNNVKLNTVTALLSKNPNAGVTVDSTWEEIDLAIRNLPTGGGPNGRESNYRQFQQDGIMFGDFVKLRNQVTSSPFNLTGANSTNAFSRYSNYVPIGENGIAIINGWDTTNGYISVRHHIINNGVVTTGGTLVNLNANSGISDYSKLIKISDTRIGLLHNKASSAGFIGRTIFVNPDNGNFTLGTASSNLSNGTNEAYGLDAIHLTGNLVALVHFVAGGTGVIKLMTLNETTGAWSTTSTTNFINSQAGTVYNIVEVNRDANKIQLAISCSNGGTNDTLSYRMVTFNIASNNFTFDNELTQWVLLEESPVGSGRAHRTYVWKNNGKNFLVFMYPNVGANSTLLYGMIEIDSNNVPINATRSVHSLSTIAGSGYSSQTSNVQTTTHRAEPISDFEWLVVFRANDNAIRSVVLNLLTHTTSDTYTINSGTNFPYFLTPGRTKNGQFFVQHSNGALTNNARTLGLYPFNPFRHVRKAIDGDVILGVVTDPKAYPTQVGVTTPPLS